MDHLDSCRACLAPDPYLFMPMGAHPPANMFVPPEEAGRPQPAFPLNTQVCLSCGLIQVADQIPADFFRHYLYVPSGASTMHRHFGELARVLTNAAEGGLIVDIGCNDGLLLSACNDLGGRTLGVDPAANLAVLARARGVDVHVGYFDPERAAELLDEYEPAKVIVTTNTFNHIPDLHSFMTGITKLLAEDGVFVIEVPRALDLLEKNEFDTVYHEHVSEFSVLSIARLGEYFDMAITSIDPIPVHGGSMRVFMHRSSQNKKPASIVERMLREEAAAGMLDAETYDAFAERIEAVGQELLAMLQDMKKQGLKNRGVWCAGEGADALEQVRNRSGPARLPRRPQSAQAGNALARHADPNQGAGGDRSREPGRPSRARLELLRRDP